MTERIKRKATNSLRKEFTKPAGGFDHWLIEGYDANEHRKLSLSDFADSLDYYRFNIWWHQQMVLKASEQLVSFCEKTGADAMLVLNLTLNKAASKVPQIKSQPEISATFVDDVIRWIECEKVDTIIEIIPTKKTIREMKIRGFENIYYFVGNDGAWELQRIESASV